MHHLFLTLEATAIYSLNIRLCWAFCSCLKICKKYFSRINGSKFGGILKYFNDSGNTKELWTFCITNFLFYMIFKVFFFCSSKKVLFVNRKQSSLFELKVSSLFQEWGNSWCCLTCISFALQFLLIIVVNYVISQ